jgi:hypothetical protein
MSDYFAITLREGALLFTQPKADGIMYCNDETCFEAGQLAGVNPFVVGHRTLKQAAQHWILDRLKLIQAYQHDLAAPWPFMRKEAIGAVNTSTCDHTPDTAASPPC